MRVNGRLVSVVYRKDALGVCCVKDCGGIASVDSEVGIFCRRCWEEVSELYRMANAKEEQRVKLNAKRCARKEALQRAWRWILKWIWIPNLVLVFGLCAYIGLVFGYTFAEWIQRGEWR